MNPTTKKVCKASLAVLTAAIICGCIYLDSLMPIITGYAAKNLASAVFVSGREPSEVEDLDLDFSFIALTNNKVDYSKQTVTSRFLWGKSTAVFREGYGVTLLRGVKADELKTDRFPLPAEVEIADTVISSDRDLMARLEPVAKALVDDRSYGGTPFAFVAMHDGAVVAERYKDGITADMPLLSWSMAKSFTNALAGVMAGDSLVDIYAPMDIPQWQDDGRKSITLNDLMQMQSGLEWNEDYGNRSDVNLMLHREKDMGLFALSKPLAHEPGTYWYYSSGSTNIVMRYLRGKFQSDSDFLEYLRNRLFTPLGVRNAFFEQDMSGTPVGSSYLYVTAREFARFGQMYLDDGLIGGERILPEGWVEYTTTPASASGEGYGSFFWLNRGGKLPDVPKDMFSCDGHDGQEIYIVPSRKLVVAVLGYSPRPDHTIDFNGLLRDIIKEL